MISRLKAELVLGISLPRYVLFGIIRNYYNIYRITTINFRTPKNVLAKKKKAMLYLFSFGITIFLLHEFYQFYDAYHFF